MQVKVTLSSEVRDRLAARAALESRSLAAMGGLLLERALVAEPLMYVTQNRVDEERAMGRDVGTTPEAARSAGMASGAGGRLSVSSPSAFKPDPKPGR